MATTEVVRHTGVDTAEAPSAAWGWHGTAPRFWHITLLVLAGFLLLMLRGNHVGRVEDVFLISFAAITVAIVARDFFLRRRGRIH